MLEVTVKWSPVAKLGHAAEKKDSNVPGVYVHLLHLGNGKNIFYVGQADNIWKRQGEYFRSYMNTPNMKNPANNTFDIVKMESQIQKDPTTYQNIHSFLCGGKLGSCVKGRFVFLGDNPVPGNITESEFHQMRSRFGDAIHVCAGLFEKSSEEDTRKAVEATLHRYFINRYKFDEYSEGRNIIGMPYQPAYPSVHIINRFTGDSVNWLTDLPVEL